MSDAAAKQISDLISVTRHLPDESEITMTVGAFNRLLTQVEECPKDCEECHPPGCSCTAHDE